MDWYTATPRERPPTPLTNSQVVVSASGGFYLYTNSSLTSGVYLPSGGNAWCSICDRNAKENFSSVDLREVLEHLAKIEITTWNYKSEDPSDRHMSPMAQDFYATFGLGQDERQVSAIDPDGVALAAIQGLCEVLKDKEATIQRQQAEIRELRSRLSRLEALFEGKQARGARDMQRRPIVRPLARGLPSAYPGRQTRVRRATLPP